jgi:hypothetical protein
MCRRCLVEWSIYLHLHTAESMVGKGQTEEAVQQVAAAAALAGTASLLQQQVRTAAQLMMHVLFLWSRIT